MSNDGKLKPTESGILIPPTIEPKPKPEIGFKKEEAPNPEPVPGDDFMVSL